MTLLKKDNDEDKKPEFNPAEVLRMEKFIERIKSLAVYLGGFYIRSSQPVGSPYKLTDISTYDDRLLAQRKLDDGYRTEHLEWGPFFLCVAGNNGQSKNPFVKILIENIFPRGRCMRIVLSYGFKVNENKWKDYFWLSDYDRVCINELTENRFYIWRDDVALPSHFTGESFLRILKNINEWTKWARWKPYNLFWNLFLLALDDDIYNKQLSNVVELAHYLDFDEPMLRDWCRAVEYVMDGNKLSENCDLECETVEGARFFLHKEYE